VVRQPPRGRLGDAEVDHLRHRLVAVERDQHVRRLEITVDDAFLVRVLDAVADLLEEFQPLRRGEVHRSRTR